MYQLTRDYEFEKKNYPFAEMKIGDSFFAPGDAVKVRGAARYYCKFKVGVVLKVRKEEMGCRCYRIA
jgi:hypothetical protein